MKRRSPSRRKRPDAQGPPRVIVLAAGVGSRMRSARPKVLHALAGRPLVTYAVDAVAAATGRAPVLVVGTDGFGATWFCTFELDFC